MLSKILCLGDRIELTRILSEERKKQLKEENSIQVKPFISQIYDIIDEEQLKIAMPIVEGRVIPLPLNVRFDACFYSNGGLYKSRVVITDRYKEDGLYILVIELTTELKKFQRRQYYRLDCSNDIIFRMVEKEEIIQITEDPSIIDNISLEENITKGVMLDISGGGIRFVSDSKLEKGTLIVMLLNLVCENGYVIKGVVGNVLFSDKLINKDGVYEQRVEFSYMSKVVREHIIRYIFEQERKLRQKQ